MNNLIAYILFLIIVFSWAFTARSQDFDPAYDVADVMADLLKTAPARPLYKNLKKRTAFAKDIVSAANKYNVPELLFTVKIFNESSFKMNAVSDDKYKTKGLGQMHGVSTSGCDTKTRAGQLECSARWLNTCYKKCGTWEKALAAYGTQGFCDWRKAKRPKAYKFSINSQVRMWLKYEQQRERIRAEIIDDLEHYAAMREGEQND